VVGLYGLHQINSALVRPAVLLFIALCVAAVMVGLSQAEAIWPVDPNTGIRLIFWRDVLGALVDTNFVGIGFGREAIRTTYVLETLLEFGDLADPQFIFIGTHSAFMDVLLRLGGVGGLLLVLYLASVFPSSRLPPRIRTHACIVYALVFLCCLVNVALQSPTYMFGIVFALGYLQALKRAYAPAPRPGRDQSG
ncbi:MAG TPA: hypothetical protein VK943_20315, partial [Arenibaculum sp.]|nr:hypothetical protein [Arenibaculum sp.]